MPGKALQATTSWVLAVKACVDTAQAAGNHPCDFVSKQLGSNEDRSVAHHLRKCVDDWLVRAGNLPLLAELASINFPVESTRQPLLFPFDAFHLGVPVSGFPPLLDWVTHLMSIMCDNYDNRDAVDVAPGHLAMIGKPLTSGCVAVIKGYTRMSIIGFILLVIFNDESLEELDGDDADQLTRRGPRWRLCENRTVTIWAAPFDVSKWWCSASRA